MVAHKRNDREKNSKAHLCDPIAGIHAIRVDPANLDCRHSGPALHGLSSKIEIGICFVYSVLSLISQTLQPFIAAGLAYIPSTVLLTSFD